PAGNVFDVQLHVGALRNYLAALEGMLSMLETPRSDWGVDRELYARFYQSLREELVRTSHATEDVRFAMELGEKDIALKLDGEFSPSDAWVVRWIEEQAEKKYSVPNEFLSLPSDSLSASYVVGLDSRTNSELRDGLVLLLETVLSGSDLDAQTRG